jgi:small subunit ribosomal protein S17e
LIEKFYGKMSKDFHYNKRVCDDFAIIPTKRIRNKVAGYASTLMKRIEKGPVRGISLKLQEEERERKMEFRPTKSEFEVDSLKIDNETAEMLKVLNLQKLLN